MLGFKTEPIVGPVTVQRVTRNELLTNRSRRQQLIALGHALLHQARGRRKTRRVLLCIAGVIPRGTRFTWPMIERRFVHHLRAHGFAVDVYGFNLNMGSVLVDGVQVDQRDVGAVPFTYLEEAELQDADAAIEARCRAGSCPRYVGGGFHDDSRQTSMAGLYSVTGMNAARQLLSENRVGEFLLQPSVVSRYEIGIVWWAQASTLASTLSSGVAAC